MAGEDLDRTGELKLLNASGVERDDVDEEERLDDEGDTTQASPLEEELRPVVSTNR